MPNANHESIDAWSSRAACIETNTDVFFPNGTEKTAARQIELAKAICGVCAVQRSCLLYALENKIDHGIWGGTTERERRKILKAQSQTNSA